MTDLLRPLPGPSWRERATTVLAAARARPALAACGAVIAAVAIGVAYFAFGARSSPPPLTLPKAPHAASTTPTSTSDVVVDVAGAVSRPGVVRLANGARATDAVAAAGGAARDADLDQVNLAARVSDGDRVYVPRRGESVPPPLAASGPDAAKAGPIDVNSASADQLDGLPGVGPATAAAILEYRTKHGRFRAVDELLEVPGIGPAKLATLRPRVRV